MTLSPDTTDIVLSIDDLSALPGETIVVPIAISDAEGVQSLTLSLTYDTSILNVIDPDDTTDENENVRRAGISADWVLEPINPVANVDEETGEIDISLVNTQELPTPDSEGNPPDGTILEIEFEVDADAELGSVADLNLQEARIGIDDTDLVFTGNDNLDDGTVTAGEGLLDAALDTNINRFQNSDVPGTYLFATETESVSIRENFPQFDEEGVAFRVADEQDNDELIPIYRFQNNNREGTFIFVKEEERQSINENFPDDFTEEGLAFYVYDIDSSVGITLTRFQNSSLPGTFLFAGPGEVQSIRDDFPVFDEEGDAFNVGQNL